jgi:hypothetical protein
VTLADQPGKKRASEATRWSQLLIGIICMVMIANLQYGWTLFTIPLSQKYGWNLASIQVAFTLFVLFETWLVPAEGYLVDRLGPRIMVFVGEGLTGLAWVMNSYASSRKPESTRRARSGVDNGRAFPGDGASDRVDEGFAVEMEAAALYAFAQARAKPVICFAHVTNQMARMEGDFEKGEADGAVDALALIAAVARAARF